MLRPYSFNMIVMRIFIFLLISGLLHLALLQYFYFTFDEVSIVNKPEPLSIVLLDKSLLSSKSFNRNLNEGATIESLEAIKDTSTLTNATETNDKKIILNKALEKNQQQEADDIKNYFPITEVDRKALPQTNIDQSMLANEVSSGLPITLRLYINAYGRVVKVEKIAILDQDAPFAEKLANLLYEVRFLPAKRESLDVDSYQDLQLSFNPISIPSDN